MNAFPNLRDRVQWALLEDLVSSDVSVAALKKVLKADPEVDFEIVAKEGLVFCAEQWTRTFEDLGLFEILEITPDGIYVEQGVRVLRARSKLGQVLSVERSLLNGMQRWSGVATLTRVMVERVEAAHRSWPQDARAKYPVPKILHTRKTTPLWRDLEIAAVLAGGGNLHRCSLAERPMIKENHKEPAVRRLGSWSKLLSEVLATDAQAVVEVETWAEAEDAASLQVKCLLLDNFTPAQLREGLGNFLSKDPEVEVEVSGGINASNLEDYVIPGVSRISMGSLTHGYRSVDLSLNILEDKS